MSDPSTLATISNFSSITQWVWVDQTTGGAWNPQTMFSDPPAVALGNNGNNLPAVTITSQPTNVYVWPSSSGAGPPISQLPVTGFTLHLDSSGTIVQDSISPGTIAPANGTGAFFTLHRSHANYDIHDTVPITINNSTGSDLPYFVNTMDPQESPGSLTAYTKASANATITSGASATFPIYNTVNSNVGIYFFDLSAASTDTATAVSVINTNVPVNVVPPVPPVIVNTPGTMAIKTDGTTLTVTKPTVPTTPPSSYAWVWFLVIGIIIVIIAVIIAFFVISNHKRKEKEEEEAEKRHGNGRGYDDVDLHNMGVRGYT